MFGYRCQHCKDGNTTHVFKPVEKPTKKVTTIWVTADGKSFVSVQTVPLPKDHFDGYEFRGNPWMKRAASLTSLNQL